MKTILAFLFTLFFSNVYAQEPAINADSVVIKLTLTTREGKKLETLVNFEDLLTHKIKQYKKAKQIAHCQPRQITASGSKSRKIVMNTVSQTLQFHRWNLLLNSI